MNHYPMKEGSKPEYPEKTPDDGLTIGVFYTASLCNV